MLFRSGRYNVLTVSIAFTVLFAAYNTLQNYATSTYPPGLGNQSLAVLYAAQGQDDKARKALELLEAAQKDQPASPALIGARARALATQLAAGPTAAYVTARRLMRESLQSDYAQQLSTEATSIVASFGTEDGLEGVRAFHERRRPVFHGA